MKTRNRSTRIKFAVFNGYEVRVILAADLARTGRRLHEPDNLADAVGAVVTRPDAPFTCWLLLGPDGRDSGTIAHEASHAVRILMRSVGARLDDEAFAYHLDYLVGRIHRFIKRRG